MRTRTTPKLSVSRREFGKRVALLGSAAIVPSADLGATTVDEHGHSASTNGTADQSDSALQKLSPESRLRFETMWDSVIRKHGSRFTDEQKARIRKIIANNVTMLEAVYAVPLKNGDPPASVLRLAEGGAELAQRNLARRRKDD